MNYAKATFIVCTIAAFVLLFRLNIRIDTFIAGTRFRWMLSDIVQRHFVRQLKGSFVLDLALLALVLFAAVMSIRVLEG